MIIRLYFIKGVISLRVYIGHYVSAVEGNVNHVINVSMVNDFPSVSRETRCIHPEVSYASLRKTRPKSSPFTR